MATGQAELTVTLDSGVITVRHGDGAVLWVVHGDADTWVRMFDAMTAVLGDAVACDECGDPVTVAGDVTCGDCQRYLMRGDA